MIEILPIRLIAEEDRPIFGSMSVNLGKLSRMGFPVSAGIVVSAPEFKLKTVLEHFDFKSKEVFEQSLTLVKKEILSIPVPDILKNETGKYDRFLHDGQLIKGVKNLWQNLLNTWLEEIKTRLWKDGFFPGISEGLESQIVAFAKKIESLGTAFFDPLSDDVAINISSGKIDPGDQKKIHDLVVDANKKLFLPYEYEWILDRGVKLIGLKPYTPALVFTRSDEIRGPWQSPIKIASSQATRIDEKKSAVKVFLDLSAGLVVEREVDGVYISSEKIFDLNHPNDSFENLVFKIVESAITFPSSPVLLKLTDMSEGMGKVRGALRLLHQKSLFEPMVNALDFARHKKGLTNVHMVVPFVRGVSEFLQIKRELAVKKLMRKNSLQLWMEVCVPENIINLEEYLVAGLDGVVLNLDELVSFLNGFDSDEGELVAYKNEVNGLLKFLEDGLKLLHKSKVQFIAYGTLCLYPQVLEFLVEKGAWGIIVEKYEAHSAKDLLHQVEKRIILRQS